ncbi:MAG: M60 family metallopeptidase [Ureaplasma sp.]|nr:M60 family metallopeptidase [Ureaplasma sp.]
MKKTKKYAWILGTLTAAIVPSIVLTSVSCSSNKSNVNFSQPEYISLPELEYQSVTPTKKSNLNYNDILNDGLYSIGTYDSKIIGSASRPEQVNIYNSQAYALYHEDYGFEYPSQKYNYEELMTGPTIETKDLLLPNKNNPNKTISAFDAVLNEVVVDDNGNPIKLVDASGNETTDIRFNNPKWIIQEINNKKLRKHRAAIDMYLNQMNDINAVQKQFTLSTATKGPVPLGLFAPAGEIITIQFNDATWELINNNKNVFSVVLNSNFWDNRAKSDTGRPSNRYPYIKTTFSLSDLLAAADAETKTIKIGSPFGGGISFFINDTLKDSNNIPSDAEVKDLNFTISGAIPCMFYQDGVTSESDWNKQIQDVQKNQLAPLLQATAPYYSLEIPFNGLNTIGGKPVGKLIYPKDSFKKWNDFLYLSNYLAGTDLKNSVRRLDMEFCDDIWGAAGAWGGGMRFYCPTNWGVGAFFYQPPEEVFNAGNSWGVFHEINHNFQQDSAFFNKRTHGETNQVTAFNLSVISDVTHARSEMNWSGEALKSNTNTGWQYLDTPYSVIKNLLNREEKGQGIDEYPIYSVLLFWMGSKNYADYVRDDVINHPSNSSTWTGMQEIQRISERFKINMWPAFKDYGRLWSDWNEDPTIANDLASKYPAMDFVANQYACGQYLYDKDSGQYIYNGDQFPAFEIPAGSQYTLYLDDMITSINKNFKWLTVNIDSKPTHGTLEVKGKKLLYTPNKANVNDIDEFDITITPGSWTGKPSNYVPGYKFKIKIRQVLNRPILETFNENLTTPTTNEEKEALFSVIETAAPKYSTPIQSFNTPMFLDETTNGVKVKFKFIAPKSGTYNFKASHDDYLKIKVKTKTEQAYQEVYKSINYQPGLKDVYSVELNQNDTLDFENILINNSGGWGLNMTATCDGEDINIFQNSVLDNLNDLFTNISVTQALADPKYKYKPRNIDRSVFTASLSASVNLSDYTTPGIIDSNIGQDNQNYTFTTNDTAPSVKNYITNLGKYETNSVCEKWVSDTQDLSTAWNGNPFEFEMVFTKPTNVTTLYFGHTGKHSGENRPTDIKVVGYTDDNDTTGTTLYDGKYGTQFNDRNSGSLSVLNLTTSKTVKKLKFTLKNTKYRAIILEWIRVGTQKYSPNAAQFGFNNPFMTISNNWIVRNNDDNNSSSLNNLYFLSEAQNNEITFTLNNANGFAIIGQKNNFGGEFDVYIDGTLVKTVSANSSTTINNACLYSYQKPNSGTIQVRIVTKNNSKLYLNYIMTFGQSVYLSK